MYNSYWVTICVCMQEDITKIDDTSLSPESAPPTELEDTKDELTTVKEEQAPDTQPAPPGDKDHSDMHSNMEEVSHTVLRVVPRFSMLNTKKKPVALKKS